MYKLSLKAVGSNMQTSDFQIPAMDRGAAVAAAIGICATYLAGRSFDTVRLSDNEYALMVGSVIVGSFTLQRI